MAITFASWSQWEHSARQHLRRNLPKYVGKDDLTILGIHNALCKTFNTFKGGDLTNQSLLSLCQEIYKEYAQLGAIDSWNFLKTDA